MLRRTIKRQFNAKSNPEKETETQPQSNKVKIKGRPLGSTPAKDEEEQQLERLVLGGEEELLEKLAEAAKVF